MKNLHFPRWLRKLLRQRLLIGLLIIAQAAFLNIAIQSLYTEGTPPRFRL